MFNHFARETYIIIKMYCWWTMITENYSISFLGLDPLYYSSTIVGNNWNIAADKIYEETGIRISGRIQERYIVGQDEEELNNTIIFLVESSRVPDEVATEEEYWDAYRDVIEEVRRRLGNPRMDLTITRADMYYFRKIWHDPSGRECRSI